MAAAQLERLQAPSGGINTDAAPDYLPPTQAADLLNLLPGVPGKVYVRGPIRTRIEGITTTAQRPDAFWTFDDFALIKGDAGGGTKTWRCNIAAATKTDVTATLVEVPLDYRYARYGAYTYGAIVDAASPQLGRWDGGATAIVPQANAPFQWTDLQVYANRLFILGGSVPGTTTPVNSRTLYFSDPDQTADLSLLASWKDDISGLVNQINYDGDDTPIGLAGCGKYMAIIGTRSINLLTGTGSSSFSIRNLTKNLGCVDINTIVEVDDGFFYLSDRGLVFCDGSAVKVVSDGVTQTLLTQTSYTAASFKHGYIALCSLQTGYDCWLMHIATQAWTRISAPIATDVQAVFRTNSYPLIWSDGGPYRAENATTGDVAGVASYGLDNNSVVDVHTAISWISRYARLGSPTSLALVKWVYLDYRHLVDDISSPNATAYDVFARDSRGEILLSTSVSSSASSAVRQRAALEVSAETDCARLELIKHPALSPFPVTSVSEIYDAWIEYVPAQLRGTY